MSIFIKQQELRVREQRGGEERAPEVFLPPFCALSCSCTLQVVLASRLAQPFEKGVKASLTGEKKEAQPSEGPPLPTRKISQLVLHVGGGARLLFFPPPQWLTSFAVSVDWQCFFDQMLSEENLGRTTLGSGLDLPHSFCALQTDSKPATSPQPVRLTVTGSLAKGGGLSLHGVRRTRLAAACLPAPSASDLRTVSIFILPLSSDVFIRIYIYWLLFYIETPVPERQKFNFTNQIYKDSCKGKFAEVIQRLVNCKFSINTFLVFLRKPLIVSFIYLNSFIEIIHIP